MNVDEIRASFYGTWHATYLEADGLTPEESRGLPQAWRELLAAGECAAESVAALWREACPRLPRVADYLENNVIQVGLSRMTTPHHAVRDLRRENQAGDDTTEIALVYITRDLGHVAPFNAWIGRQPFQQELPPWWGPVRSVLGDLATTLHDGFMLDSWDQGLLAVRDSRDTLVSRCAEVSDQLVEQGLVVPLPGAEPSGPRPGGVRWSV